MLIAVDQELRSICQEIAAEGKSLDEWALVEADDWFQTDRFNGGFDASEGEFCFSYWNDLGEYWFQLPISDVVRVAEGELTSVEVMAAT